MMRATGGALLFAVLAWPSAARAEETFTVAYAASPSCPDRARFVDELSRRTQNARPAGPGEQPTAVIAIRLTEAAGRVRGRLELTRGTRTSSKELDGVTCEETASALALVAALAIDPLADTRPVEVLPERAPIIVPTPPIALPVAPERPPAERYVDGPPAADAPAPLPAWPLFFSVARQSEPKIRLGLTASFELVIGAAPRPMAGGGGWFEVAGRAGLPWSLRLGLTFAATTAADAVAQGVARYRLVWVRGEGCVPGWAPGSAVTLYPCVRAGGGPLWGELSRGGQTLEGVGPWASVGLAGRAAFHLVGPLTADLDVGAEFPVIRPSFVGIGGSELFSGAPATFDAMAGLGFAF